MRGKKALINIITSIFLEVIKIVCGFIAPIMIINAYGSEVNGLISSITQFLAYITLLESGVGPVIKAALYKPIANKDNKEIANILKSAEKFFRSIAIIFIIYVLVLCVIYPLIINNEFDSLFSISLILIIAISSFAEYFFGITYRLFIQADQKRYVGSTIEIIATVINTIFIVVLIKMGSNVQVVKLFSAFAFILRPLLQNLYFRKKYNISLKDASSDYKLKNKWDGLSQHIASVVHSNTDIVVLTLFSNMKEVSVYSVYLLVMNGVKRFVEALNSGIDSSFGDMIVKNEEDNLRKKFGIYETMYYSFITVVFICILILIVPFVSVYTKEATDANYIRPVFAFIITLAEFVFAIRLPYNSLIKAAGHFKETMKGAWVETITNITLSVILVMKFGLVGVAIGTLVAMSVRTIEFFIHGSKAILKRSIKVPIIKVICISIEVAIMLFINTFLSQYFNVTTYFEWIVYAICVFVITSLEVALINFIVFKDDFKNMKGIIHNILNRKYNRKKEEDVKE